MIVIDSERVNCVWCLDVGIVEKAVKFYRDSFGNDYGLCKDDAELRDADIACETLEG